MTTLRLQIFFSAFAAVSYVDACDEFSWDEVQHQQTQCLETQGYISHEIEDNFAALGAPGDNDLCSYIRVLHECSAPLRLCEDSHQLEIDLLLAKHLPDGFAESRASCNDGQPAASTMARQKRTAKKRGGGGRSGGSSSRSTLSRVASTIRRTGGSGGGRSRLSSILRGGGSRRAGAALAGGAVAKKAKKGKTLKKFGKYAVAGLAAYGAYKVAKKMSKGLKAEYDDDDCWEYSFLTDDFRCVCDDCNIYVGAAVASACSGMLVAATAAFSLFYYYRQAW